MRGRGASKSFAKGQLFFGEISFSQSPMSSLGHHVRFRKVAFGCGLNRPLLRGKTIGSTADVDLNNRTQLECLVLVRLRRDVPIPAEEVRRVVLPFDGH